MASIPATIIFPSSLSTITFSSISIVTDPPLTTATSAIAFTTSSSENSLCLLGVPTGLDNLCTPDGASSVPTSLISFSTLTAALPIPSTILPDSTLCSVAFTSGLSYEFVVNNQGAQNDIRFYLPLAIARALNITDLSQIMMEVLSPYNTSALGYTTTLAIFWLPTKFVERLSAQITQGDSNFYTGSPDSNLKLFTRLVNSTFPLTGVTLSSEAPIEPSLVTTSMITRLKSSTTSPTTTTNSTTANSSQATIPAIPPPNSDLSLGAKAGIGVGVFLGVIVLLGLIAFLVSRHLQKVRTDEPKSQQALDKDGDPRSELNGSVQPVEKDGVARNELSSGTPIWELPGE